LKFGSKIKMMPQYVYWNLVVKIGVMYDR
jgi:hypothetical protein